MALRPVGSTKPVEEKPKDEEDRPVARKAPTKLRRPGITPLSAVKEFSNLLVYGDPGCGKSVLTGTGSNGLLIAADKGTVSAARLNPLTAMDVLQLRDFADPWEEFMNCVEWLKSGAIKDEGYQWVFIDSATHLQELALRWIIDQGILNDRRGAERDIDVPQLQDHYKWQLMWKRYVRQICDLPVNTMWTALAMRKEDDDDEQLTLPQIQGKDYAISAWTCAEMDSVGYMQTIPGKNGSYFRRITWERTDKKYGKDRFDVLGPRLDNPTMPKIAGLINGSIKRKAQTPKTTESD